MVESVLRANGVDLCYEMFGSRAQPALLLVMGFTAQMTAWDEEFCEMLAGHGFCVIRYDNRDCGRSTKTTGTPPPLGSPGPYGLTDMAADGLGLLAALGIERAHVVGASMGGMIVQHMAFEHPTRVLTMTSIMSTTGDPAVGASDPQVLAALLQVPPTDRVAYLEHAASLGRVIAGPLFDEGRARSRTAIAYDRGFNPRGALFQMGAIVHSGDRTSRLGSVSCPTLVIHGAADRLINPSGGKATAAAIQSAEVLILEQMGHDLPEALWPQATSAIAKLAARAG